MEKDRNPSQSRLSLLGLKINLPTDPLSSVLNNGIYVFVTELIVILEYVHNITHYTHVVTDCRVLKLIWSQDCIINVHPSQYLGLQT